MAHAQSSHGNLSRNTAIEKIKDIAETEGICFFSTHVNSVSYTSVYSLTAMDIKGWISSLHNNSGSEKDIYICNISQQFKAHQKDPVIHVFILTKIPASDNSANLISNVIQTTQDIFSHHVTNLSTSDFKVMMKKNLLEDTSENVIHVSGAPHAIYGKRSPHFSLKTSRKAICGMPLCYGFFLKKKKTYACC